MYEKCAQIMGDAFNAKYVVYLLLAHKYKLHGDVKDTLVTCPPIVIFFRS